jgi:ribosomal-protein-alanine acetyltransferase
MGGALGFRIAEAQHLAAIDELERKCFDGPWVSAIYEEEIRRATSTVELAALVERPEDILGVSCSWIVAGECHLLRVLTDPRERRRGVGRALVKRIIERSRQAACETVTLEVASRNSAAISLYERSGFLMVGRRPGYYKAPPDDAVLMTLAL